MTDAEKAIWRVLRSRQLGSAKFRRQQPIGRYVVDIVCHDAGLIIEADGGQHAGSCSDQRRTEWLEHRGYRVLRAWNGDILTDMDGVVTQILCALATPHPPTAARRAPPSPSRGEGKNGASNA